MTSHAPAPSYNPQRLVLLGSTGSIGTQTLEVLSRLGEHAPRVVALAAGGSRLELLARQAITWEVPVLAVTGGGEDLAGRLRQALRAAAAQAGRPFRLTARAEQPYYCTILLLDAVRTQTPAFNPPWQNIDLAVFRGEYLFPEAFAQSDIEWIAVIPAQAAADAR